MSIEGTLHHLNEMHMEKNYQDWRKLSVLNTKKQTPLFWHDSEHHYVNMIATPHTHEKLTK